MVEGESTRGPKGGQRMADGISQRIRSRESETLRWQIAGGLWGRQDL